MSATAGEVIKQLERFDPSAPVRVVHSDRRMMSFEIEDVGRYDRAGIIGPNIYVKDEKR